MANNFGLLKQFLSNLQQTIIDAGVFPADNVQLSLLTDNSLEDNLQYPQGSPILEIIPLGFRSIGWDAGGGVEDLVIDGEIQFRIIVLNVLDTIQTDGDVITSTDQTLGVYELLDQLISELEMLMNCDGSGNSFTIEPIRLTRLDRPRRLKDHPEWVVVDMFFQARICQNIDGVS